jgi:hypothetical protein
MKPRHPAVPRPARVPFGPVSHRAERDTPSDHRPGQTLGILRLELPGEERGQLTLHADEDLLGLFVRTLPTRSTRREAFWKCSTFHEPRLNALTMGPILARGSCRQAAGQ